MKPVVLESPFAGDLDRNRRYTEACLRDTLERGETAYASHRVFPGALDDGKPHERKLGIDAGLAMSNHLVAHGATVAFYIDFGMSGGMVAARDQYPAGTKIEYRTLARETIASLRRKL